MVISFWSAKGGSGTTVTAAAVALTLRRSAPTARPSFLLSRCGTAPSADPPPGVLVVDASGDLAAVLGIPEPEGPGLAEWLAAGADVPPDGLGRLEVAVDEEVSFVPRGRGPLVDSGRAELLAAMLANDARHVVIDCGCLAGPLATTADSEVRRILAASSTTSILVTRSCFLALRRAIHGVQRPGAVVLIAEPGRTLTAADVSAVLDVETVVTVPWDSGIARAVDAGLLVTRLPSKLARALTRAA